MDTSTVSVMATYVFRLYPTAQIIVCFLLVSFYKVKIKLGHLTMLFSISGGALDSDSCNVRKILHFSYTFIVVIGCIKAYLAIYKEFLFSFLSSFF